jgi:DNA-binding response OmpR family regulator
MFDNRSPGIEAVLSSGRFTALQRWVLVVDDDPGQRVQLAAQLGRMGCRSHCVPDGHAATIATRGMNFDLLLVDATLPDIEGAELVQRLRHGGCAAPIVMMASSEAELLLALEVDPMIDDCLIKPFGKLDLAARLAGALRRASCPPHQGAPAGPAPNLLRIGDLLIDPCRHCVEVRGDAVTLTAREFDLLNHLAHHPGRVFTRPELLDCVWGCARDVYEHTVNSHVNRLRSKIERDPATPRYILTVWSVGYKFAERSAQG